MARTDPQINLRVPIELKKKLEILAIENSRSLNAEVVIRLENTIEQGFDLMHVPTEVLMMELSNRFKGYSIVVMENKDIKKAP